MSASKSASASASAKAKANANAETGCAHIASTRKEKDHCDGQQTLKKELETIKPGLKNSIKWNETRKKESSCPAALQQIFEPLRKHPANLCKTLAPPGQ